MLVEPDWLPELYGYIGSLLVTTVTALCWLRVIVIVYGPGRVPVVTVTVLLRRDLTPTVS